MLIRASHMVEERGGEGEKNRKLRDEVKKVRHFVCISEKHPPLLRFVYSCLEASTSLLSYHFLLFYQFHSFLVFLRRKKVCGNWMHFSFQQRAERS